MCSVLVDRIIFAAPKPSYDAGPHDELARHLIWIPRNDALQGPGDTSSIGDIPCLWLPAKEAGTVMLYFHANADDLGLSFASLQLMREHFQVNVLAMEYPGYGLFQHVPSSEGAVYSAAVTVLRYLVDKVKVDYPQIVIVGRSLGSCPALHLASQYPIGGLILINPFTSLRAVVRSVAGQAVAWMIPDQFMNESRIANVSCPVLFIAGGRDRLVPPEHSARLYKLCRSRKLLVSPPSMEHNSHLFNDAAFFKVPAIHFFGFPSYRTERPPGMPAEVYKASVEKGSCGRTATQDLRLKCSAGWCATPACFGQLCDQVGDELDVLFNPTDETVHPREAKRPEWKEEEVSSLFTKRQCVVNQINHKKPEPFSTVAVFHL